MASATGTISVTVINLSPEGDPDKTSDQVFEDTPSEFSYPTYVQRPPPVQEAIQLWWQLCPLAWAPFDRLVPAGVVDADVAAAAAVDVKAKAAGAAGAASATLGDGFTGDAAAVEPGVLRFEEAQGHAFRVHWQVDAVKLFHDRVHKKDKSKVSPSFQLPVAGQQAEFKIWLVPKSQLGAGKKTGGFDKSQGECAVQLRCLSVFRAEAALVSFIFVVGGERRGPVHANFGSGQWASLPKETQLWKLGDYADAKGHVSVSVELVPGPATGEESLQLHGAVAAGA